MFLVMDAQELLWATAKVVTMDISIFQTIAWVRAQMGQLQSSILKVVAVKETVRHAPALQLTV